MTATIEANPVTKPMYLDRRATPGGITPELLRELAALVTLGEGRRDVDEVIVPYTGEVLGTMPHCTADDVVAAARLARAAQPAWSRRSFGERAAIFKRFHDLVLERQDQLLDLIQLESGKARLHAFEEVLDTAIVARYYAYHAREFLRPRRRKGAITLATKTIEFHHPVGVVGYIEPWNYPLNLGITDAIAALMAGNTAVLRPDVQTPFTALRGVSLLYEAGLPRDVMPVVTGPGRELGAPIIQNVDFIMFTGSTATGKLIARQAAERLIGCSLELGGKNPMIVLADADVEKTAEGAVRGCFVGAGQVCISIERIFVHDAIFDRFRDAFVARTGAMKIGGALEFGWDMGSLTSARQLDTVTDHVRDAVTNGAKLLAGGKARPDLGPYFYEPTILADVRPGMKAYADETFGPVVSLYRYTDIDRAVEQANDTRYGLNASVWSRSHSKAIDVAKRIRSGTVNINEPYSATWGSVDAEIGGMKESGMSRRHGREGILKYTEPQTVSVQRFIPIGPFGGMSETTYAKVMTRLVGLMRHIPGLR
jgi:acyl-CoA reductase-like NAD-dependent aldehyde dehydrogenase